MTAIAFGSILPARVVKSAESAPDTITLNLKNADINSLIETVSIRTGRNFIVDPRVRGVVNVVSSEPVDADRLYELFLSVLEVNGFTAVDAGGVTKIIPTPVGIQSAVPIFSDSDGSGDQLVSQVLHLQNASAPEVAETLQPLLPASASLTANATSNTIVVTDYAASVQSLIRLVRLLDSGQ